MGIFDNILGNWIQIIDEKNEIVIDDYGYGTGVIEGTTGNHCVKCVAVNRCWFKNEIGKKPERFITTKINVVDGLLKGVIPGLYHFRCHCQEISLPPIGIDDINLIIPIGKVGWLFKDKPGWILSMGYNLDDEFTEMLYEQIKKSYFLGNYVIQNHNNFGVKINLNIDLPGRGIKSGKIYKLTSNFMVFPNGRIKANTLIGGWQK